MKHLMKRAWTKYALVAVVTAMVIAPTAAIAGHNFSDVPSTHTFHGDIEWMLDNAITTGCGPAIYCPDSNVTRGQMAAFMKRLATKKVVDAKTALTAGHATTADSATTAATAATASSATNAANADKLDGLNSGDLVRAAYAVDDGSGPGTTNGAQMTTTITAPVAGTLIITGESLVTSSGAAADFYACGITIDDLDGAAGADPVPGGYGAAFTDQLFLINTCVAHAALTVPAGTYTVHQEVGSLSGASIFNTGTLSVLFTPFEGGGSPAAVTAGKFVPGRSVADVLADMSGSAGPGN